ncbi:hypothetical protein TREMEDRAFT_59450 [Tremella mesenterica DSM 1558]|uniref:uncharacterized protein n=1 Tax=Tremella mesenterica (strain ATCC 24925 / CBS 8224 / DSM 1558 / NBRC 9311 / NRRL Y-6157 / RJB 2259-6 / UBC 559-6) TaxID=578456 RepID=UPI0003F4A3B0|nr:uncharacterized protein TREMEDRAFT_59450 [Tremella mesenterica DSM 1558]EIW73285.1 hypothetical protein TREMEDRAFT_59450 [Tremella mesenterica DSM 1558]
MSIKNESKVVSMGPPPLPHRSTNHRQIHALPPKPISFSPSTINMSESPIHSSRRVSPMSTSKEPKGINSVEEKRKDYEVQINRKSHQPQAEKRLWDDLQAKDLDSQKMTTDQHKEKNEMVSTGGQHDPSSYPDIPPHKKLRANSPSSSSTISTRSHLGPILPLPLPSKRYKDPTGSRALLLPVDQLPVYPLPPLPIITNPILEETVFTHCSMFDKAKGKFEDSNGHYEKLEHVGDSILGMVVTTWLHDLKPGLTCGTATKLKAHLVSNATLSHISGLYNLPSKLRGDPNQLPVLRAQTDVRAAMVEAYIAALYFSAPPSPTARSKALEEISAWLKEMYEPLYDFFLRHMLGQYERHQAVILSSAEMNADELRRADDAAIGMSGLLLAYGARQGKLVEWEEKRRESHLGTIWEVGCKVDGEMMGHGTRSGRKSARNAAAWEGAKRLGLSSCSERRMYL